METLTQKQEERCTHDERSGEEKENYVKSNLSVTGEPKKPRILDTRPPFPGRFEESKKAAEDKNRFETFHKVEVNILLIDAIMHIPKYARFLKARCEKVLME